mmetsp:Transcript_34134/g.94375  ORF Transcript_34134/g.94375 Transcript_34134/m.94375 type:complete len:201 (-) Transcript_34134:15-617(-)
MAADYGTVAQPALRHVETDNIRASVASFDSHTVCLGWSLGLQYFIFGCLLVLLSSRVPANCGAQLHEVFLALGTLYVALAVVGGASAACGGAALQEFLASKALESKYQTEQRDIEAMREGQQAWSSLIRLGCISPCLLLVALLFLAAIGCWMWGAVVAFRARSGHCGSSFLAFWVSLALACVLKCCGVQCSIYWAVAVIS